VQSTRFVWQEKNTPIPDILDKLRKKVSATVDRCHFIFLLMILVPLSTAADTIVLKSGKRVEVDMAWEENNQVKGTLAGVNLTYPKSEVERIEKSKVDDLTGQNRGFKFDVWYSGMNIRTVQSVAEKNNINLQRGESSVDKTDPNDSADDEYSQSIIKMEYTEHILGKSANIELIFTPVSQKLHRLSIHWPHLQDSIGSEFFNKVISSLINGYGKPAKKKSTFFDTSYIWNINKSSNVELNWGKKVVVINYVDAEIE
jgi:hypothetical protein